MITRPVGCLFLLAAILFEGASQLFFKLATHHDHHDQSGLLSLWHTVRHPAILVGIVMYVVNMTFYTIALQSVDLSLAFPAEGLTLIVVAFLSRMCLKETITTRRWFGILLVMLGAVMIGMS